MSQKIKLHPSADTEGFKVTVIPAVNREDIIAKDPYLAFAGGLGKKASRPLGEAVVDQTNSIEPATGQKVPLQRGIARVSLGAKMSGVPGDVHLSKSGR